MKPMIADAQSMSAGVHLTMVEQAAKVGHFVV
jgi:hypothetical protein